MNKAISAVLLSLILGSCACAQQGMPSGPNQNWSDPRSSMRPGSEQYGNGGYNTNNTAETQKRTSSLTKTGAKKLLNTAISKYKTKNFIGAMQDLEDITYADPGNALAHYYLAMCYVQIGDRDRASSQYDMVISLSPNSQLATNANIGKNNLKPDKQMPDINKIIDPAVQPVKDFFSEEAKQKIQEKDIKNIIDNVNNNRDNNPEIYKRLQNFDPSAKKSSNDKPSQEDVKAAMEVLTKAGINPYNQTAQTAQAPQMNSDMMQLNMLMSAFGGGNNIYGGGNNNNSMMPLLMMMQNNGQGNSKIDPETIQVMMSEMMMSGMSGLYENNNKDN